MPLYPAYNRLVYNVVDFGADASGTTDSTIAISAANSAASGAGGIVFFPPGTFVTGQQTLYSNVHWEGSGIGATIVKLANNANTDLFVGSVTGYLNGVNGYSGSNLLVNVNASNAVGSTGGVSSFSFTKMTIDGNRGNQSGTSYCMRFYGYDYIIADCAIRNGYSGGVVCDWNGGSSQFTQGTATGSMTEGRWSNVKVHNNGGIGLQIGGPHDCQFSNVLSFFNDSHGVHIGINAAGAQFANSHVFGCKTGTNSVGFLVEPGYCVFSNCESEGSDTAQVVFLSSTNIWSGSHSYMTLTNTYTGVGFQLGQLASKSLATAQTASPLTLSSQPSNAAPVSYLQFVVTGASASGTISISGTGLNGTTPSETINASGNGTYQSTNWYQTATSITVTGLTGYSIAVNALPVPYNGSYYQSAGAATAAIAAGCTIRTNISRCESPSGAILFANDAGNNYVSTYSYLTAGTYYGGTINPLTQYEFFPTNSLTPTGPVSTSGGINYSINSQNAFRVTDRANDIFNINTTNKKVSLPNVTGLYFYNDSYTTENFRVNNDTNGTLYWHAADSNIQWRATGVLKASGAWCTGVSSSAAALASSGTITTNSIGVARVAPTASVTGVIMQAGQINGQECWVVNESSFSITMASSGTSNVAAGTLDIIGPNQGRIYKWDGGTNLWYPGGTQIYTQSHLVTSGGSTPTVAALGSNGTGAPTPTATGNDTRGNVQFGSGTSPTTGSQISVTFATAYSSAPIVVVSANNLATTALQPYVASVTTTGFNISVGVAAAASQTTGTYSVNYIVHG